MGMKDPKIVFLNEPIISVGLNTKTSTKTIRIDAKNLSKKFKKIQSDIQFVKEPIETIVITQNYFAHTGDFIYFLGRVITKEYNVPTPFEMKIIPKSYYAYKEISCFFSLIYPFTLIKTKKFLFNAWLPRSNYTVNKIFDDFEYHTKKSEKLFNFKVDYYIPIIEKLSK